MLVIFQYIAQVNTDLLGIAGIIYIIPGQLQGLAVIGHRTIGDVVVVEAVDVHIFAILAGQIDGSLAILCVRIFAFSIIGN